MMNKWRGTLSTLLLVGALGLVFLATSSAQAALPAGTISYWKLDENVAPNPGDTDVYEDSVNAPNGNNGDIPGAEIAPTFNATGKVGGAQDFDSVDTAIDVPDDNDDFDWGAGDSFSIEFWMKGGGCQDAGSQNNEVMIGREDTGSQLHWWLGCRNSDGGAFDGAARFQLRDTGGDETILTGTAINDDQWHHIVGVRDVNLDQVRLYVDSVEVDSDTDDTTAGFDSLLNLNIGWLNLDAGYHFDGTLDNVALYSRALTQAEITAHFNAGNGIDLSDAVPDPDPVVPPIGGGGSSGGCFIGTAAE
jgi:hypothetical protein